MTRVQRQRLGSLPQSSVGAFWQVLATTPSALLAEQAGDRTMSVIGYARTSTLHQDAGLDAQLRQLQGLGCDKVFSEQVSSVADRGRLTAALEYVREGDTFEIGRAHV